MIYVATYVSDINYILSSYATKIYMHVRMYNIILCISVGFLISFVSFFYASLWLFYSFHFTLKVFYPLKSPKLFNSDHKRTIFIAETLIASFIAAVPSVVVAGLSKYNVFVLLPPALCLNVGAYRFFALAEPVHIIICATAVLLLLVLYKIHAVCKFDDLLETCTLSCVLLRYSCIRKCTV